MHTPNFTAYITLAQAAELHKLTRRWILTLAKRDGSGAIRVGNQWQLPDNWIPPGGKVGWPKGRKRAKK